MSPGMKAAKLWFSLPARHTTTHMCSPRRASQLVWSWREDRWRGRDWGVAKAGHCRLTLRKEGWTLPLTLGTKWFPGWYTDQKGTKPHRSGCKENAQLKAAFCSLVNDQSVLVSGAWSLCTISLSIMAHVEAWLYCITARSPSVLNTFDVWVDVLGFVSVL